MWPKQKRRLHRIEKELSYLSTTSSSSWKMSQSANSSCCRSKNIYCDNILPFTAGGNISVSTPLLTVGDLSVGGTCKFVNSVPECGLQPTSVDSLVSKKFVNNSFVGYTTDGSSKFINDDIGFKGNVSFEGDLTIFKELAVFTGDSVFGSSSSLLGQVAFNNTVTFYGESLFPEKPPSCNIAPVDSSSLTNKEYVDAHVPSYTGFSVGSLGSLFNFKAGDASINGVISAPYISPFFYFSR